MVKAAWLILAILVFWAHPSHAVSMAQCPDGQYWYPVSEGVGFCPSSVGFSAATPTTTTVVVTGSVSTASGTVYASVRLNCDAQQWRVVANGVGDESSATDTDVTSGSYSITLTGLAESTEYCVHVVQYAENKPTKTITSTFTTLASTPASDGDEITGGDDWFYCPDGSDANSGLTHALRKATLPATDTSTLGASDDMWLCTGGVWNTTSIDIARAGTSGDWSETGCYYMDGATPRKCLDGEQGFGTTHTKPEFRGGITDGCLDAGTCTYPNTGFPREGYNSQYDGIISLAATADYHIVQNIALNYGRYGTIVATGGGVDGGLHHLVFDGIDMANNGFQSMISMVDGVSDAVVRNSTSYRANQCEIMKVRGTSSDTTTCNSAGWPGTTAVSTRKGGRILYEYNTSIQGFGEGINVCYNGQGDGHYIARNNVVVNAFSGSIYVDGCANAVVENNIILGGNAVHNGWTNVSQSFAGVNVGMENIAYTPALGHVIRNNLFVGATGCVEENMFASVATAGGQLGAQIYGNTCIAADDYELRLRWGATSGNWVATNNLIWNTHLDAANQCSMTSAATGGYNHWVTVPSDADCVEASNTTGAPGLTQSTYSWWQNIADVSGAGGYPTLPTFADAKPAGGSVLIGAGTPLTTSILDIANYGFAFDQIKEVLDLSLTESEWECALCVDALGVTRANPPSQGAVE